MKKDAEKTAWEKTAWDLGESQSNYFHHVTAVAIEAIVAEALPS